MTSAHFRHGRHFSDHGIGNVEVRDDFYVILGSELGDCTLEPRIYRDEEVCNPGRSIMSKKMAEQLRVMIDCSK